MNDSTRRNFLKAAGLTGTAGVVAATLGPVTAADAAPNPTVPASVTGGMAVYVKDVRGSSVLLMVNGNEVTVSNQALCTQLANVYARAARGKS